MYFMLTFTATQDSDVHAHTLCEHMNDATLEWDYKRQPTSYDNEGWRGFYTSYEAPKWTITEHEVTTFFWPNLDVQNKFNN